MHTSKDDYLINTIRFVSMREETQIYGAILPESLTSLEMKETKAYKTYIGFASGATPPKKARKFKKLAFPKLTNVPKSKRVKRPAKKSIQAPTIGVVIREIPKIPVSKKKEKVDVTRGKGIELLSDVALTEEANAAIIKPSVTNEGTGVKPGVPDVTEEESSKSEVESWGNDDDDNNNDQNSGNSEHETDDNESGSESNQEKDDEKIEDDEEEEEEEIVKTPSNDSDDEDETKIADKAEVEADKGFVQEEGIDAAMTNVQQGNENPEISQVIEYAHVKLSTVP
ncbi:hypothetical protein Tco_0665603 [Tanacetum coccineum]